MMSGSSASPDMPDMSPGNVRVGAPSEVAVRSAPEAEWRS
jgi:hypothetical protein